ITETAVIADMEKARQIAESIIEHGFRFAVDDFGAGFSSLYYLKQLPISYVKLDRSLVKNISQDKGERDYVNAITTMVHAFGKQVVAEGVEDKETLRILTEIGVDLLQGYYIGRPKTDRARSRKISVLQSTNSL
ncbi:MAG: EAL domain-containing protein, partial [Methylococcales bacterium]